MRAAPLAVLAVAAAAPPAAAHVAPSEDANNRYVKLTPMADRVRLAYTILIGQQPGRAARRALDTNGDGTLSEAEADVWGRVVAADVLAQLEVRIDGADVPLTWSEVYVGLDTPSVTGGAFSLDLITWLCVPGADRRHELDLVDRYSLLPAGETEVRIADEPGVRVDVARVGAGELIGRQASFQALAAPLANGLRLVWTTTTARPLADGRCPRAPSSSRPGASHWIVFAAGAAVLTAVTVFGMRRRRRR